MTNLKGKYNSITIPKELNIMVEKTISKDINRKKSFYSVAASLAAVFLFSLSLNVSPAFAESCSKVPIINRVADVLTIRSYHFDDKDISGDIKVPSVTINNDDLENYVNQTIDQEIKRVVEEAKIRVAEYKEAYIETGGTEAEFAAKNMSVTADYEVYLSNEHYLSFRVFTHETLAAVYGENLYFTLDLDQQKMLSLEDLIGSDYQEKVMASLANYNNENPDVFFEDVLTDFVIRDDLDYYLNALGETVVVFEKYELAAGVAGRLSFTLK